jgi:peptidoglycan/LPS O-acetylase OafA/YrhL
VVLPAIFLTLLCDSIGSHFNPGAYDMERETEPLLRILAGASFLSASWGWNLDILSNTAFWSLPYEFFYYVIFAIAIFFQGTIRLALLIVAALIAGPNILMLLPIWLFGVVAYRMSVRVSVSIRTATVLWMASTLGVLAMGVSEFFGAVPRLTEFPLPYLFSPVDYLTGILVATNIYAASFLPLHFGRFSKPIAACAGTSFAIYLFHVPLLHLAGAFVPTHWSDIARGLTIGTFALVVSVALSSVTEKRKNEWRLFFGSLFEIGWARSEELTRPAASASAVSKPRGVESVSGQV